MNYELLSAEERDAIVRSHLFEHLSPLGMSEREPRSWIDGSHPPVRRLFELHLVKGAGMKACWGFSLDFVPHISGGRVRWHRTDKAAMLDVIVEPKHLIQPTYIHGTSRLIDDLRKLLPEALNLARASWHSGSSWQGLIDIIREIRTGRTNCFGFDNYTQLPLAFAFLSAKLKDLKSAEREIDSYANRRGLEESEAAKLKEYAKACAGA